MRLIDADALKNKIEQHSYPLSDRINSIENGMFLCGIYQAVDESPTADAVPVVRGEWIAEQKGAEYCEFRCSSCDGSIGQTDQFDETEVKQFSEWYKFCPNCGADMRGSEGE